MNVSIADVAANPSEPLGQYIQRVSDSMRSRGDKRTKVLGV